MDDLIVRQGQDEVLAPRVEQPEGQLAMVVPAVYRVVMEVVQGVVHPTHVPLEPKPQSAQIGRPRHTWPGGGLLGDDGGPGVEAEDHLVDLFDESDGFEILTAAESVWHPLAFGSGVVQVEHRGDRVHPQAVHMKLLDPVEGVGDEEVAHLVAAEVEHQGAPIRVLTLPRVGVLIERGAIEARQRERIPREMGRDPIEDHTDAPPVQGVHQPTKIVRRPEPRRRCVIPRHLVTPRTGKRVLGHRQHLDVGEPEIGHVVRQLLGQLPVGQQPRPAVLVGPGAPRSQVELVHRHRPAQEIALSPGHVIHSESPHSWVGSATTTLAVPGGVSIRNAIGSVFKIRSPPAVTSSNL